MRIYSISRALSIIGAALTVVAVVTPARAQDKPRLGGELIFVVPAEPPTYDGHREGTFALVHPGAPHYNTLLRIDPTDRTGTKVMADLGESWTISADGRTYTVKLRRGVKFPHSAKLRGWTITPSHYLNNQLDVVWLSE